MIQADFVDFDCETVDEFAFGELETLFEDLHDVHTSVMVGVDEVFNEHAGTGYNGFGRPFARKLSVFSPAEVEMLLGETTYHCYFSFWGICSPAFSSSRS